MIAAERDELFADWAAAVGLPLALLGMTDHPLHLVAARQAAVGVPALAGVHQGLDTPLDRQLPRLLRVVRRRDIAAASVQIEAQLLHLVGVAVVLVAGHAKVEVLADGAVVARLHGFGAGVAVVDELVLALGGWKG